LRTNYRPGFLREPSCFEKNRARQRINPSARRSPAQTFAPDWWPRESLPASLIAARTRDRARAALAVADRVWTSSSHAGTAPRHAPIDRPPEATAIRERAPALSLDVEEQLLGRAAAPAGGHFSRPSPGLSRAAGEARRRSCSKEPPAPDAPRPAVFDHAPSNQSGTADRAPSRMGPPFRRAEHPTVAPRDLRPAQSTCHRIFLARQPMFVFAVVPRSPPPLTGTGGHHINARKWCGKTVCGDIGHSLAQWTLPTPALASSRDESAPAPPRHSLTPEPSTHLVGNARGPFRAQPDEQSLLS